MIGSKAGTYHWDVGPNAHPHDASHLQIDTHEGPVVRFTSRTKPVFAHAVMNALHRGRVLAAALPATQVDATRMGRCLSTRFVAGSDCGVFRNHGIATLPSVGPAYHIRSFEVDRARIENDECIAEPDMDNKRSYFAFGDEDLTIRLRDLGVAIEHLDLPYRSNYPI